MEQSLADGRVADAGSPAASQPAVMAPSGAATTQYLRFAVGTDAYAVRVDAVREILEVTQMTPLPLMPEFVRGVMNLRGAVVPVLDLAARLGLQATVIGRRTCVVIVDAGAAEAGQRQTLGMLVDAVHEVFDFSVAEAEPVPRMGTRVDACHLRCITRSRGQVTPELNLDAVFDLHALTALIARHQALH